MFLLRFQLNSKKDILYTYRCREKPIVCKGTYAVQTTDTLAAADWKTLDAGNQPLVEHVGTATETVVRLKAPISATSPRLLRLRLSQ